MISEKPKSEGLNKTRVWIALTSIMMVGAGALAYNIFKEDSPTKASADTSQANTTNAQNLSDQDILSAAKSNSSQPQKSNASTPIVASNASEPVPAIQANQQQTDDEKRQNEEARQAMRAQISSNQIKDSGNTTNNASDASVSTDKDTNSDLPKDDQNQTAEKRAFIKSNSKAVNLSVKNRIADYVLAVGTKIPAQIDQDINSDLPGQIYGHTTRDVYDSRTNKTLLIPAGSNLVGTYDSSVAYGQERLLVAWTRINMPNGQFIDLPGFGGADAKGAGFGDQVDNHYDKIFGATVLISILATGAQLAQPQQSNALQAPGIGQTIGQSVGTQIAQTGTTLMNKNLNLQPTLHIRPGFEFSVEVNKDMVFDGKYQGNSGKLN